MTPFADGSAFPNDQMPIRSRVSRLTGRLRLIGVVVVVATVVGVMLVSFAWPIAYNHAIYLTSAAALIAAAGFFLKPFYILTGFLPLLLVTEKNKRVHLFSFQVGLIGTMTLVSVLALHQSGMLANWLDVQFGFNLSSYSSLERLTLLSRIRNTVILLLTRVPLHPLVWIPWLVYGNASLRPNTDDNDRLLLGWLILGLGFTVIQGRLIEYQAFAFLVPAAAICALGVSRMPARTGAERAPAPRSVIAVALATATLISPVTEIARYLRSRSMGESRAEYWDRFVYRDGYSPGNDWRVAQLVGKIATRDARVEVWGQNTALLYLSKRAPPTGFVAWIMLAGADSERRRRYRERYLREFERHPPAIVVTAELGTDDASLRHLERSFDVLAQRIRADYSKCQRVGHLTVYQVRSMPLSAECSAATPAPGG